MVVLPKIFAEGLKGFSDLERRGAHTRKYMYIKSLGQTATRLQTMLLSKHLQKKWILMINTKGYQAIFYSYPQSKEHPVISKNL